MTPIITDAALHLQDLYAPHELSHVNLHSRRDIVRYLEQERRNVVFVLRRTAVRPRDDPLHQRLRYFLNIVSKTDIDFDLLEATAVLPTTLYTIFNYVDPEGRFLPEEKYCAKLLYADLLSQGWQGRTKSFAWSKDEWYPFVKNSATNAPPTVTLTSRAKPPATITRQRSDSGAATRPARRNDLVKAVSFDNATSAVESDANSHDVIQRASSLDTGRDRHVQSSAPPLVQTESIGSRPERRTPALMPPTSPTRLEIPLASPKFLAVPEWKGSATPRRHRKDSASGGHPHFPPTRRDSATDCGTANIETKPHSQTQSSSPDTSSTLPGSPWPSDAVRGVSPPRHVSIITPIATSHVEESRRKREATLFENINRLRSQVESIEIQELPLTPWMEHLRLFQQNPSTEHTLHVENTNPAEKMGTNEEAPKERKNREPRAG